MINTERRAASPGSGIKSIGEEGNISIILPPGVSKKQWEFLCTAEELGLFELLDPRRQRLIITYFTTTAAYLDLTHLANTKPGGCIQRLVITGLAKLWGNLPSDLQNTYPREEVVKGKDPRQQWRVMLYTGCLKPD